MSDELVGRTLADYLAEHERLPLGEGLALLDALLQLVGEAHRDGVADGGLTPGRVVVTDLGRVKLLSADASPVADAEAYLSPQQRDGKPADVRADVYALGVIAYRMLMGVLPYAAGADDPADPHAYLPNLTERVRRTLAIAVQQNLTERFGDALTFRAALRGDSDLALASPTLRWAVAEGIPEGDEGAAEEFAEEEPGAQSESGAGGASG